MPTRREVISLGARLALAPALASLLSGCSVLGVGGGAGGALPDIFQMDMRYLGQFVSKGLLADVTKLADTALNLKDFDQGLLSQGKVKDALYSVPLGGIVEAMVYDITAIKNASIDPPT